jgi:hypothetical protein
VPIQGHGAWWRSAVPVPRQRVRPVGEAISDVGFDNAAGVGERREPLIERGGADTIASTQLGERQGGVGTVAVMRSSSERRRCRIGPVNDLQGKGSATLCRLNGNGVVDGAARCSTDNERSSPSRRR